MFNPGNNKVGNFLIWVSATRDPDYFQCLISEEGSNYPYYVHLHRDPRFSMEFKAQPKPLTKDMVEAPEHQIYRREYDAYQMVKEMTMPLWTLHKNTLVKLMAEMDKIEGAAPIA